MTGDGWDEEREYHRTVLAAVATVVFVLLLITAIVGALLIGAID